MFDRKSYTADTNTCENCKHPAEVDVDYVDYRLVCAGEFVERYACCGNWEAKSRPADVR